MSEKKTDYEKGLADGQLKSDLGYIKTGIDDLKKDAQEDRDKLSLKHEAMFERINKNSTDLSFIKGIGSILQAVWAGAIAYLLGHK